MYLCASLASLVGILGSGASDRIYSYRVLWARNRRMSRLPSEYYSCVPECSKIPPSEIPPPFYIYNSKIKHRIIQVVHTAPPQSELPSISCRMNFNMIALVAGHTRE